ncbi:MAG TPA: MBL fold metallo-hydrolase [Aquihabitans sp.]|nr:MBL fold metallo-hydrolase [Aquihabitans sp.]
MIEHLPEIGVTVVSRWLFNCYVVHDGGAGQPMVVDLGIPSHVDPVADALRAAGSDLDGIIAVGTHGHADHVGGLPELRRRTTPTVHLPRPLADLRDGSLPLRSPGPREISHILPVFGDQPRDLGALREVALASREIGYDHRRVRLPFEPDGWLADGDRVPGAPDWEVVHTPGHTDDSTSLYNASTRTLLSGDAVLSVDRRAWFNPEFVDAERSAATEARLRALDVEHLLPGHGRTVTGDVMGGALSFRERPPDDGVVRSVRRVLRRHRHT